MSVILNSIIYPDSIPNVCKSYSNDAIYCKNDMTLWPFREQLNTSGVARVKAEMNAEISVAHAPIVSE